LSLIVAVSQRERGLTVHVIGDAAKPGQVWDATQAGYQLARTL
jgi:hypothetical protein